MLLCACAHGVKSEISLDTSSTKNDRLRGSGALLEAYSICIERRCALILSIWNRSF